MRFAIVLLGMMIEEGLRPDWHPDPSVGHWMVGILVLMLIMDCVELIRRDP